MERRQLIRMSILAVLFAGLLANCGGEGSAAPSSGSPISVAGAPAANGVFDAALTQDGSGGLWMSYSVVNVSSNDAALPHVSTRIASSGDGGVRWSDAAVAPNVAQDIQVPYLGGATWATWQFEVSRLLYDPHDSDASRRWKLVWHRYLQADLGGVATRLFEHGWVGYSTAASATGPWSSERKLFVGSIYNAVNDSTIGAPEYNLATAFPGMSGCGAFSEPGMLATASGVYISLKCYGTSNKVVLLRCTRDFTPGNCAYRGDLLADSEAQQFAPVGQSYDGFSATDLVAVGGKNYLLVTPTLNDSYRGCLVFEISSLDAATLVRDAGGKPILVKRVGGDNNFHGACGYAPAASASGIVYGRLSTTVPQFRLYSSRMNLP